MIFRQIGKFIIFLFFFFFMKSDSEKIDKKLDFASKWKRQNNAITPTN